MFLNLSVILFTMRGVYPSMQLGVYTLLDTHPLDTHTPSQTPPVWGKVIFSQASVILSMLEEGWLPSMHHRSHNQGVLHPVVVCIWRGWADLPPPTRYMGYYRIRSTNGRYASYWNAFLFMKNSNLSQIEKQHWQICQIFQYCQISCYLRNGLLCTNLLPGFSLLS